MSHLADLIRHRIAAILHDLAMIPVAWLGAFWLRFNLGVIPEPFFHTALYTLPLVMLVQGLFFWRLGLYRGVWRFASLPDLIRIVRAVLIAMPVVAVGIFLIVRLQYVPRSVFPLYALLLTILLGAPRLIYRWYQDRDLYMRSGQRVLIVGAGRAGEMLVREMLRTREHAYRPVGFVDDDRHKHGREIQGIRVLGNCDELAKLVVKTAAEVILIALPSAPAKDMRRIVALCESTDIPVRTLPPIDALVSGRAVLKELRQVSIEDLLGRDPVSLEWRAIGDGLSGKVVLVSGGGGSIGSELCRQIARLSPAALVILEQSEYNLYRIEMELVRDFPKLVLHACLGDVTDKVAVDHVMKTYRPEMVFHAAAYKHVPMLELQAREAVRNNVLGTQVLARAADKYGCREFVLISTDKAVNPENVMGATKRTAEIVCQSINQRSATRFVTVRFGNVLGSAGSVVPLFQEQMEAGGPVTVTHPKMTRYFMTISEACQLIMQAGVMAQGGEIYVLDMGEPVNITYLAEQMIRLSGKEPHQDVEIIYTGLRPGEKLNEELFHEKESLFSTGHDKILLAQHRTLDWSYVSQVIEKMEGACQRYNETELNALLRTLVPEFAASAGEAMPDNVIPMAGRQG